MRHRTWVVAALTLGLVAAACSRQEGPQSSGQGSPIAVGQAAPSFSLKSASGGTVALSDYARKPVLLYFSMGPG